MLLRLLKRGPRRRVQPKRRVASASAAADGLGTGALARAPRRGGGKLLALPLQLEQLLLLQEMELQTNREGSVRSTTGTEQSGTIQPKNLGERIRT